MTEAGADFARMQDYVVGRLSEDERREFEDRLLHDPELARELEQSLRMRAGLQQLRAQGYFARVAFRRGSFRFWQPALAAAALAGLALFLWVQRETGAAPVLMASLEARSGADVAPLVAAHFTFVTMRGDSTPDLDLPSAGLIEIRVEPPMSLTDHRYRVQLVRHSRDGSDEPVGGLTGVRVSSDGYVHCFADASRLTAGSYLLRIQPDTTDRGVAQAFRFNLSAGGTRHPQ